MQKSPNMRLSKNAAVSETESESSSEEETNIPLFNIVNKIKTEPQSSSGDSDSESDKNQVFTQKTPLENTNYSSISNKQEKSRKAIKKEAEQTLEDSDTSVNKKTFQTNKYIISKSFGAKTVNKMSKQISQDSDESSSSSEQDTLRGAFLGQVKAKSKKQSPASKLQSKQKLPVTRESGSSYSEDSNNEIDNKKVPLNTSVVQKQKVNVKDNSKLNPQTLKNLPKPVQTNSKNKHTPEKGNKKNSRKSDPSIPQNNENVRNSVEDSNNTEDLKQSSNVSTDTVSIDVSSNSHIAKTNRVQVLQHIKFTPMKPKELLQDLYPDLKTVNIKDEPNISDNEEVYLLRIPKTVDPQQLLNKEVDLIFGSKVKVGSEKYEFVPTNKAPDPILLIGNQSRAVQPKNTLFLKKYIKSPKVPDLELIEKAMIPLPENLKPRHPLFGSNYEDKIQLSSSVELRLQKALEDCLKEKVKKKNKKKKVSSNLVENDMNEVIFSLLGNHIAQEPSKNEEQSDSAFGSSESHNNSAKKEKAKRKSADGKESTMFEEMPVEVEDEVSTKKKKKNKSNKSTNSEWRVNNFEPAVNHQEPFRTELSVISSVDKPLKKTHKQKDERINKSSLFGDRSMFESTRIEGEPSTSSKKESIINETINRMKTELLTEYESEWDETLMKKNKKKKRKSLPEELQDKMQTGNIDSKEQEIITPSDSVNSKRHRSASSNKIKTELLTEYESEWDETLMKKKKKKRKSLPEELQDKMQTGSIDSKEQEIITPCDSVNSKRDRSASVNKIKTELLTEYESEWDETLMKKKKKKRKSLPEEAVENRENENVDNVKKERINDFELVKPKISNRSMSPKRMKTELLTEYESEWDESLMMRKKKKKRKSVPEDEKNQNDNTDSIKEVVTADLDPFIPKIRKRSMSLNQMKTELLTEYESERDEALMTKKKKKKRKSVPEEEEKIQNGILNNIKQQILVDFKSSTNKMRKRSMSTLEEVNDSEMPHKKSKKSKKNSSLDERIGFV